MLLEAWEANDLYTFGLALAVAAGVLLALALVRSVLAAILARLSRRTATPLDDSAADAIRRTRLWLLFPLAVQAGSSVLELPPGLERIIVLAALGGLVLQAGLWASFVTREWIEKKTAKRGDGEAIMALTLLGFAARVAIWAVVVLVLLDQLGFNITALVAGLGIGGIAIALAVQNILGDLFAALAIVVDKPFVVGDFIVVDNVKGTVEHVGLKTTRLRSLGGEQIVVSNSDLLRSRVSNYRRMQERRVVFHLDVTYDTAPDKVERIPAIVREVVGTQNPTRFDRCHFLAWMDSALRIETVYYVLDADYTRFADIQHAINIELLRRFAAEKIEFAFPSRTVIVKRELQAT